MSTALAPVPTAEVTTNPKRFSLKAVVVDGVVVGEVESVLPSSRPNKYTVRNCAIIQFLLSKGVTVDGVCHYIALDIQVWHRWLAIYPEFRKMVAQAEVKSVLDNLNVIDRAKAGGVLRKHKIIRDQYGAIKSEEKEYTLPNGNLALKMLERQDPEHYGPRRPAPLRGTSTEELVNSVLADIESALGPEEASRAAEEILGEFVDG